MQKTKTILKYAIPVIVLFVAMILNVILLCTDVYEGVYKSETTSDENTFTIEFTSTTYRMVRKDSGGNITYYYYGFYVYIPEGSYSSKEYDYDVLVLNQNGLTTSTYTSTYERSSVFTIISSSGLKYTCYEAIILQVFYVVLMVASITTIIVIYSRERSRTNNDAEL